MNLVIGTMYVVEVVKAVKSGIIVKIADDESTELIHLSNISEKFVADPLDFVSVGNCYVAECIKGKAKPCELSLKHLNLRSSADRGVQYNKTHEQNSNDTPRYSKPVTHDAQSNRKLDDMIAKSQQDYDSKFAKRSGTLDSRRNGRKRRKGN